MPPDPAQLQRLSASLLGIRRQKEQEADPVESAIREAGELFDSTDPHFDPTDTTFNSPEEERAFMSQRDARQRLHRAREIRRAQEMAARAGFGPRSEEYRMMEWVAGGEPFNPLHALTQRARRRLEEQRRLAPQGPLPKLENPSLKMVRLDHWPTSEGNVYSNFTVEILEHGEPTGIFALGAYNPKTKALRISEVVHKTAGFEPTAQLGTSGVRKLLRQLVKEQFPEAKRLKGGSRVTGVRGWTGLGRDPHINLRNLLGVLLTLLALGGIFGGATDQNRG